MRFEIALKKTDLSLKKRNVQLLVFVSVCERAYRNYKGSVNVVMP